MLPRACKSSCALWPVAFGLALVWGCPGGNSGGAGDPIGVLVFNDGDQGTGPLAVGQVAFTQPGVPVTVRLVGESPSGEPLSFSIVSAPALGELGGIEPVDELTADITYVPPADFIGAAEFTYQVDDGVEQSGIATVTIGVCPEVAFELDVYEGEIPLTVHATAFTVAGGDLPDGELCWSFGGLEDCGAMDTHRERSHTFSAGGTYAVTLSLLLAGVPVPLSCMPADLKDISAAQVIALDGPAVWIWGQVRDAQGRALPGVSVATDDGAAATVSDASGRYKLALASGWGGTVRPQAPGRTFEPASRSYEKLVADKVKQDFVEQAAPPPLGTLVVSPSTGLSSSGPEGGPFTPASTVYTLKNQGEQALDWVAEKSADWLSLSLDSGTLGPGQYASVRVSLTAAAAELAAGEYQDTVAFSVSGAGRSTTEVTMVLTNSASGEPEVTISGRVTDQSGAGLLDVVLAGLPGDPTPSTDADGYYSASVPSGETYTVTPTLSGYAFSPESTTYSDLAAEQAGQDYTGVTVASSVSQYGIVWTFDREYRVGQFVNGDWWVTGPVCVLSVTPAPCVVEFTPPYPIPGDYHVHGSVIDPSPQSDTATGWSQGYDERQAYYDSSLRVGDAGAFQLNINESLVSTRSILQSDLDGDGYYYDLTGYSVVRNGNWWASYIKACAVLTCVGSPPALDAFRPPFVAAPKTIWRESQIHMDRLPSLAPQGSPPDISTVANLLERPWLDHQGGDTSRTMHPADNMPNYSQHMASHVGDAGLLLCCNYTVDQKRRLLLNLVQRGVDTYGCAQLNKHLWRASGAHGLGRKFLIQFAARVLDDAAMASLSGYENQEDDSTYFGSGDQLWTGWQRSGHSYAADAMCTPFGAGYEFEHVDSTGWDDPPFPQSTLWPYEKHEVYRRSSSCVMAGEALVARMIAARTDWNHEAFFAYADRCIYEDDASVRTRIAQAAVIPPWPEGSDQPTHWSPYLGTPSLSPWQGAMYLVYRPQY